MCTHAFAAKSSEQRVKRITRTVSSKRKIGGDDEIPTTTCKYDRLCQHHGGHFYFLCLQPRLTSLEQLSHQSVRLKGRKLALMKKLSLHPDPVSLTFHKLDSVIQSFLWGIIIMYVCS